MTRKQIYQIIEKDDGSSFWSHIYDVFMLCMIILSVVPLMFWEEYPVFKYIEAITTAVFIIDYLLHWATADVRQGKGTTAFIKYPFTFWAIIDLLSILPSFNILGETFKVARTARLLKMFRLLKALRYSSQMLVFFNVLKKERKVLGSVLLFAICYIFVTALVMFNVEPQYNPETGEATFSTFFDALYWSAVTLTTVGYGDMCPATDIGRLISMLSAMFGIAIIALPSGIITASYIDELKALKSEKLTERLRKTFRRGLSRETSFHQKYWVVPRRVPVVNIQVKQGMTMDEIIENVENSPEFRLRNMATAIPESEKPEDRIVAEHFMVNRPYGCYIDRGSRITIASPCSYSEAGMGSFSYYLALIGGFNYISKETETDRDEPTSFYNIDSPIEDENLTLFLDDLRALTSKAGAWCVVPLSCSSKKSSCLHFVHGRTKGDDSLDTIDDTIKDKDTFTSLYDEIKEMMDKHFDLKVCQHDDYCLTNRNMAYHLDKSVNSFSLRVSYNLTCWDDNRLDKIQIIADTLKKHIAATENSPVPEDLLTKGYGY